MVSRMAFHFLASYLLESNVQVSEAHSSICRTLGLTVLIVLLMNLEVCMRFSLRTTGCVTDSLVRNGAQQKQNQVNAAVRIHYRLCLCLWNYCEPTIFC
jgi:hypothetical protein